MEHSSSPRCRQHLASPVHARGTAAVLQALRSFVVIHLGTLVFTSGVLSLRRNELKREIDSFLNKV